MPEFVKRRLFRFSLRTAFIAVTVVCIYLGWQLSIVRARQSLLQEMRAGGNFQIVTAAQYAERWAAGVAPPAGMVKEIPLSRAWLGDEAIQEIWYSQRPLKPDLDHMVKTLPEAEVREIPLLPCHPGCFPAGTLVATPQGRRSIETIQSGDLVTTVDSAGETAAAAVQSVFITDNRLWTIGTEAGDFLTTQTQPLCVSLSKTVRAGDLNSGDEILRHDDSAFLPTKILTVSPTSRYEKVRNLILGDSQIFIANGFLARSKPPARD
jgi:hypothetical protein